MHDEDYSVRGNEGTGGGVVLLVWLLVSGMPVLTSVQHEAAEPLHVPLSGQLAG